MHKYVVNINKIDPVCMHKRIFLFTIIFVDRFELVVYVAELKFFYDKIQFCAD